MIQAGGNVAVVYARPDLIPWDAINGDAHDLRFLDEPMNDGTGRIVALTAKGRAKRDHTGFVVRGSK